MKQMLLGVALASSLVSASPQAEAEDRVLAVCKSRLGIDVSVVEGEGLIVATIWHAARPGARSRMVGVAAPLNTRSSIAKDRRLEQYFNESRTFRMVIEVPAGEEGVLDGVGSMVFEGPETLSLRNMECRLY